MNLDDWRLQREEIVARQTRDVKTMTLALEKAMVLLDEIKAVHAKELRIWDGIKPLTLRERIGL